MARPNRRDEKVDLRRNLIAVKNSRRRILLELDTPMIACKRRSFNRQRPTYARSQRAWRIALNRRSSMRGVR